MSKNKHLTLDDRIEIQECLAKGMTFKAIANRIGKNQTTVSREVKAHAQSHSNGYTRTEEYCPKLLKAPFVCNGCEMKSRAKCPYIRRIYVAKTAQSSYEETLVESRSGIPLNKESFYETDQIISNAVKQGQHVYHAIKANNLPISTATVYRHINKQYYSIGRIDLPRAVKFKPRKTTAPEHIPACAKKGRTYQDFIGFMEDNDALPLAQLDTVIGRVGGKTIMTVHFVNCDFMIALLLENKTAAEAAQKIQGLKKKLKDNNFSFGDIIPVLLTDNGGEFKPEIEKNHTLFRDIVPAGHSFDAFTQQDVNLIFSHINAVKRKQFGGKSAYDLFTFFNSVELAQILGISYISPNDVIQSPLLLKKL